MAEVTNTPLTLSYFTPDIADVLLTYDRLRWWRSVTGEDGLYEPISQAAATPATLTAPNAEPHELNGKTLSFMVNGVTQVDVLFATADPVSSTDAANEIDAASALVTTSVDSDGRVVISTVATGTGASLEILESDGAEALGFQTGDVALGQGVDTTLVAGTHEYSFIDQNSDADYFYKTQFIHSVSGAKSELSVAFPADPPQGVPKAQTITAFMRLVDMSGSPIRGRKVTIVNTFLSNRVNVINGQGAGVFRGFLEDTTDRDGYVQFRLLRGIEVDVTVEATNFVRRITVPSTGDSIDLLDPSLVSRDEFGIQEQNVDFAIRTA